MRARVGRWLFINKRIPMKKYDIDYIDKQQMGEVAFMKLQASHTNRQYNEIVEETKWAVWKLTLIYPWFENKWKT